jgi:hypothetical protein
MMTTMLTTTTQTAQPKWALFLTVVANLQEHKFIDGKDGTIDGESSDQCNAESPEQISPSMLGRQRLSDVKHREFRKWSIQCRRLDVCLDDINGVNNRPGQTTSAAASKGRGNPRMRVFWNRNA